MMCQVPTLKKEHLVHTSNWDLISATIFWIMQRIRKNFYTLKEFQQLLKESHVGKFRAEFRKSRYKESETIPTTGWIEIIRIQILGSTPGRVSEILKTFSQWWPLQVWLSAFRSSFITLTSINNVKRMHIIRKSDLRQITPRMALNICWILEGNSFLLN